MKPDYFNQKGISGFGILIIIFVLLVGGGVAATLFAGVNIMEVLKAFLGATYAQIGLWFLLLGGGVVLIIISGTMLKVTYNTFFFALTKIGMGMISLSLLVILLSIFLPLISGKVMTFAECQGLVQARDVLKTVTCIFVGYSPSVEATPVTYVNFILTALLAPFVFFYYIFSDLISDMNFPSSKSGQRAIAFMGAYVALRGALASTFVEFFTYGWLGMGVLAFGVFMCMMAWSLIKKYFGGIYEKKSMDEVFEIITGKKFATPQQFFKALEKVGLPYAELKDQAENLRNWFTLAGYPSIGNDIVRIMREADDPSKRGTSSKNDYVRQELDKLSKQ